MRVRNTRKVGPRHQKRDETMEQEVGDPFFTSLQKLDDELTCPVCSDHFKEPKVLPCLHFYCKTCIANLIKRAKGRPFSCPECRRETSADGDNPESLPTAFLVNRMEELFSVMKKAERKDSVTCESCRSRLPAVDFCHECSKYICTDCSKAHKQMWLLSSHRVVSIDSLRSTISSNPPEKLRVAAHEVKCRKHKDEALKLYCEDCHRLVCRDCIVIDHKDHEYAFVIDAAPLCKAEIKEKSESVKEITKGVKSAVKSLGDSKKKLSDHGTATARAIDEAIDEIVAKLAEKRKELKEKAGRIVSEAEEKIATEEKNAQLAVGELESLLEFMSRSLETATDQEVLSLKKQVADQVARVTKLYGDAEEKFPVPELPELVVRCGEGVKEVVKSEITVTKREKMVAEEMDQSSVARPWEWDEGYVKKASISLPEGGWDGMDTCKQDDSEQETGVEYDILVQDTEAQEMMLPSPRQLVNTKVKLPPPEDDEDFFYDLKGPLHGLSHTPLHDVKRQDKVKEIGISNNPRSAATPIHPLSILGSVPFTLPIDRPQALMSRPQQQQYLEVLDTRQQRATASPVQPMPSTEPLRVAMASPLQIPAQTPVPHVSQEVLYARQKRLTAPPVQPMPSTEPPVAMASSFRMPLQTPLSHVSPPKTAQPSYMYTNFRSGKGRRK